jgi:HEAT repeat protein
VKRLVGPPKSRFDVSYAPEVFTAIGPASIPPLIAALGDKNDHVRIAAIKALGEFGPRAKDAIPALTNLLAQAQSQRRRDHLYFITNSIARINSDRAVKTGLE